MKVAYNAIDADEISVCVGDVVDVISKVTEDEGWWKVNTPHVCLLKGGMYYVSRIIKLKAQCMAI